MTPNQLYRNIRRRQKIVGVLLKNGLGYVIQRFGLTGLVPLSDRSELRYTTKESHSLLAIRLRNTLEELGPTFIKLGQVLSTRPDLFPPPYIEQLEKLQDKVPPISKNDLIGQLTKELGHPDQIFAEFDYEPLAAASIGQVHKARLFSGEEVIVKIQRPGIERLIENDLQIILMLARFSEKRSKEAKRLNIVAMIEDYSKMMLRELDYAREARNTEIVYNNFVDDDRVLIPRVFWEYTTGKILTEELIEGVKLSDIDEIKRRGWNLTQISRLGTEAFLTQIMMHGFFQADPHPGNMIVVNENTIAFIDFGEIGTLTDSRLANIGDLISAIISKNTEKAMSVLESMEILNNPALNPDDFQEDFNDLVLNVTAGGLGTLNMNQLRKDILSLAYNYHLQLPSYLTALMKALITVEGVGKKLDPSFDFMETAKTLATKVYEDRLKPKNVYKYLNRRYYRDIKPLGRLPGDFHQLIKAANHGNLIFNIKIDISDKTHHKLLQLVSRLSASLIITGGLLSSAMLIQTSNPTIVEEYSGLVILGFAIAGLGLFIFLVSSMRS
jgi:ubiquinone biosynthesis protein